MGRLESLGILTERAVTSEVEELVDPVESA